MILSCDPPRHAFLIHFGKRQQPDSIQILLAEHQGARVEIAVNHHSSPPSLVAIHFVRHGFRLPFVGSRDQFSTDYFHIQSGQCHSRYFFHLSHEPPDCQEWKAAPGLAVLISEPLRSGSGSPRSFEDRPVLHGLLVDPEVLQVNVDMTECVFEFGADNLKDVPVTLFVQRARA